MDSWRWILDEDRERLDDSGFHFNLNFRGKRGKKKSGFSTRERSDLFPTRIPDVPLEVCSYKKAAPTSSRSVELQKSRNFSVDVP